MQLCINDIRRWWHDVCHVACALLAVVAIVACSSGDDDLTDYGAQGDICEVAPSYMQVTVHVSSDDATRSVGTRSVATRAEDTTDGPNGGEDGDGREDGINNENAISNITMLLYSATGGINATDADISYVMSFNEFTKEDDYTYVAKTEVTAIDKTQSYNVIVVANANDALINSLTNATSLSDVRDLIVTQAWTTATDIANYTDFVMSSESDATLTFTNNTGTGTSSDPFKMETYIERVAARIDFDVTNGTAYTTSEGDLGGYVYDVYADANATTAKGYFVLTHVMPFNELNSGSYLIKRVCTGTDGTTLTGLSYLGDETYDTSTYKATNYVVDPWWNSTRSADNYTRCFTTADAAKAATSDVYGSWGVKAATNPSGDGETASYYILDYTMENTTSDNSTTYATGLYFRGTYYVADDWDTENNMPNANATGSDRTYVYYLRHSDPDNDYTSQPMLYGVVRNNIYRVSIEKVLEADTEAPSGLTLTINVRKWAKYTHSEIVM